MAKKKSRTRSLGGPGASLCRRMATGKSRSSSKRPRAAATNIAFDDEQKVFALTKVLPAGMTFPYDFGFIPSTKAEDGDPTDVLVLMDEPAFPGCLLKCRVIGVIEGQQGKKKKGERNDRIIAIEEANHSYAHVHHVKELGKKFVRELGGIFCELSRPAGREIQNFRCERPGGSAPPHCRTE